MDPLQELNELRSVEELTAHQKDIKSRIVTLNDEYAGMPFPDAAREEFAKLTDRNKEIEMRVTELNERKRLVAQIATENNTESEQSATTYRTTVNGSGPYIHSTRTESDIYNLNTIRVNAADPDSSKQEFRDRAKRAIEISQFPASVMRETAQAHVTNLIETHENGDSEISRRVLLTGSPTYRSAFTKTLRAMLSGVPVVDLSREEQRSMQLVRTALAVGVGSTGGFAVPYNLDPTVIPTSNLSVNPFRAICRVEQLAGSNEWRGVTSAGVTAAYATEALEASDNSPTLAQPVVTTVRAQCFVPVSIELTQDWSMLQSELAQLIQDAKDDLEATKFTTGTGTNEPQGLITGATTTVAAGGVASFAVADLYSLEQALPPRFRPRAQFLGNRFTYNKARQFDTSGGANMWMPYPAPLQPGLQNDVPRGGNVGARLIGYPANEDSAMAAALTTGSKILVLGDPRYYIIVDRIGMDIEVIPHLFGAANRFPTGQRGFYAFWRNMAKVLDVNGFRVLVTG